MCLGAATLAQVIRNCRFYGPVILTHSLAPRHTGYLAGLLADIEYAGKLLVFGAGDRRCEYESYLKDLDVTLQQCRVFSEKYLSIHFIVRPMYSQEWVSKVLPRIAEDTNNIERYMYAYYTCMK